MADQIVSWGGIVSKGTSGLGITGSLIITGSSDSVLLEIDSPAVNNILYVSGSGNVGIGTDTPGSRLSVAGNIDLGSNFIGNIPSNQYIQFTGGSGEYRFVNGAGGGWYYTWCQNSGTTIPPKEVMRLSTSDNLLIGTTSDSARLTVKGSGTTSSTVSLLIQNSTPATLLQVEDGGTTRVTGPTPQLMVKVPSNQAPSSTVTIGGSALFTYDGYSNAGGFYIDQGGTSNASRTIWYDGAGTAKNLITGNGNSYITAGNLGIGISTPSASLHISGSSDSALLEIDSPAVNNILYVSGSGNVGIGTGNPRTNLDVNGGILANQYYTTGSSAFSHYLELVSTTATNGYVNFRRSGGGNEVTAYYLQNGAGYFSSNASTGETSLYAGGGGYYLNFYSNGAEAMRIATSRNVLIGTTTDSARLTVQGSGTTSSTTSFLVQNANASSSLLVRDDGTTSVLSSNEKPFNVSHTNGSSALGIVVGNGSALSAGFAALRLNDSVNVFTFGGGRTITGYPLTVGGPTDTFFIRGGGGGTSVANPSVALTDNTYNDGGYTVTSGTQTTVQIGGIGAPSNAIWKPASGNANYNLLVVAPNMSGSGTYSGTIRGIYYAPTVDSTTYGAHRAIETTAGDVIFNGGNVGIGTSTPLSSLHISGASAVLTLTPQDPLPSGVPTGSFAVSSSAPPKPYFYDGTTWNALY